jgi:hypothetical protein
MKNTGKLDIKVLQISIPSPTCPDRRRAIDADVSVGYIEVAVTLMPRQYDGVLDSWGSSVDYWLSQNGHGLDAEVLEEIVDQVRTAAN